MAASSAPMIRRAPLVAAKHLDPEHYFGYAQAVRNVLSTEIAEQTMAQLIDGLPTKDVALSSRGNLLVSGHPIVAHEELCRGALEQARQFCEYLDASILAFDVHVLQAFQDAEIGSRAHHLRLIELVAVSVHQIAAMLFECSPKIHGEDEIDAHVSWRQPDLSQGEGEGSYDDFSVPHSTLFNHINYMDFDQYPDGLADVAGYWAEDRILGGVVVFDRGESGFECQDMYIHPGRYMTTFRLWRPLEHEFMTLVTWLESENPSAEPPFPMLVTDDNPDRCDPWDAMAIHGIYRDPWERKIPVNKPQTSDAGRSGVAVNLDFAAEAFWKIVNGLDSSDEGEDASTQPTDSVPSTRSSSPDHCGHEGSSQELIEPDYDLDSVGEWTDVDDEDIEQVSEFDRDACGGQAG